MPNNRKNLFLLITFCFEFLYCGSLPKDKLVLASSDSDFAIFLVSESQLAELLPKGFSSGEASSLPFPYLEGVSQTLFRFGSFHTNEYDSLIEEGKARQISERLNEVISRYPSKSYLVVWKEDDPLSPYTKILRTTQLLVRGENQTFHFIHLELRANITFFTQYTFESWALLSPAPILPSTKPELKVKKGRLKMSLFHRIQNGKTKLYGKWIVVGEEKHLPQPIYTTMPALDDIEEDYQKYNQTTGNRLEELETLKQKKLITDQEYQQKRKEILDSL